MGFLRNLSKALTAAAKAAEKQQAVAAKAAEKQGKAEQKGPPKIIAEMSVQHNPDATPCDPAKYSDKCFEYYDSTPGHQRISYRGSLSLLPCYECKGKDQRLYREDSGEGPGYFVVCKCGVHGGTICGGDPKESCREAVLMWNESAEMMTEPDDNAESETDNQVGPSVPDRYTHKCFEFYDAAPDFERIYFRGELSASAKVSRKRCHACGSDEQRLYCGKSESGPGYFIVCRCGTHGGTIVAANPIDGGRAAVLAWNEFVSVMRGR